MSARPAVSVIIPCYNLGAYVVETVDSVLSQTYTDLEIVVVDDGSSDPATTEVLNRLRRPRTIVHTIHNRGLAAARNYGIQRSCGRYVCALDADDLLHPRFLEATIGRLESEPLLAFVSTWVECFGSENWIWRRDRCDLPTLLTECVVLTASPVRRTALDAVGGYDEHSDLPGCEDWDLWISLVERGFQGAVIPEVLFHYRQRPGSMRRESEEPAVRARIHQSLIRKHRASYERFAPDVYLRLEQACGELLRANWDLQFEIESNLKPTLRARLAAREQLIAPPKASEAERRLEFELVAARAQASASEGALAAARAEAAALRASSSWRLTGPLRFAYERYLEMRQSVNSLRPPRKTG